MSNKDRTIMIHRRTPESAAMVANTQRAMAITPVLNRLTYADGDEIRAVKAHEDLPAVPRHPGVEITLLGLDRMQVRTALLTRPVVP